MKDLYRRFLRYSRNRELSEGQRAYWAMMAMRVKAMPKAQSAEGVPG
jgi:hypothetical protein